MEPHDHPTVEQIYKGKTLDQAMKMAESHGFEIRVIEPGGARSLDCRSNRINLHLEDGKVVFVEMG